MWLILTLLGLGGASWLGIKSGGIDKDDVVSFWLTIGIIGVILILLGLSFFGLALLFSL